MTAAQDVMGDEQGHNVCILLNEAYDTLSNPDQRATYNASLEQALIDFEDDYTGKALSKWMPTQNPRVSMNTCVSMTPWVSLNPCVSMNAQLSMNGCWQGMQIGQTSPPMVGMPGAQPPGCSWRVQYAS
eukprot:297599-Chlamydomonas_euryale.AAC.2